ncbi:MAG TPA: hypothetical protein VLF67_03915 [Candidatus Saccharimonas sp.]|nr:hypothetical protein [Candidatus Saccharimonas sp.]
MKMQDQPQEPEYTDDREAAAPDWMPTKRQLRRAWIAIIGAIVVLGLITHFLNLN